MRLLSSSEVKKIDNIAGTTFHLPVDILMENAGIAIVRHLIAVQKHPVSELRIAVVVGGGNNGGDGLVAARHLFFLKPKSLDVILLSSPNKLKGAVRQNYMRARSLGSPIFSAKHAKPKIQNADVIIDAIFGTGLSRPIEGNAKNIIGLINKSKAHIISVDIPSGVSSDSGEVLGEAVAATSTVTFGIPKIGHFLYPGRQMVGKLDVENISLPPQLLGGEGETGEGETMLITEDEVRNILPKRSPQNHKGSAGHLLNIVGSHGKPGAAVLTSLGAFRIGAGLVTTATEDEARSAIVSKQPEIMTESFPATKDEWQGLISQKRALAFGPGVAETKEMLGILEWIAETKLPTVIDATGLAILAGNKRLLKRLKNRVVLTPHPGEMSVLTGIPVKKIQANRLKVAREFSKKYKIIVVLKGAGTLVASPDGRVWVNPTGNVVLATAGTGDVLTGMIAGLITQKVSPLKAAIAGVYLHGLIGDRLKEKRGDRGIVATDLLEELPSVLRGLTQIK